MENTDRDPASDPPEQPAGPFAELHRSVGRYVPEENDTADASAADATRAGMPTEHGGQAGPEPTRYGDWEKNGRCTDF